MFIIECYQRNFLGIRELRTDLKTVNRVVGGNGKGKSSFVSGLLSILKGGNAAPFLTIGEKAGEVTITIDNGWKFKNRIRPSGSQLDGWYEDGRPMEKPTAREILKGLVDVRSVNINAMVMADPAEKAKLLLELCDLHLTEEQLAACDIRLSEFGISEVLLGDHGLKAISAVHDVIYKLREQVGRDRRQSQGAVAELTASLPKDLPAEHGAELDQLRNEKADLNNGVETKGAVIEREKTEQRAAIRDRWDAQRDGLTAEQHQLSLNEREIRATLSREIAAIKQKESEDLAALKLEYERKVAAVIQASSEAAQEHRLASEQAAAPIAARLSEINATYKAITAAEDAEINAMLREKDAEFAAYAGSIRDRRAALTARIQQMESQLEEQQRGAATRQLRDKAQANYEAKDEHYQTLSAKLRALDDLRLQLVSELPIPGLDVHPDHILTYKGIPIATVNEAELIKLSLRCASIRRGDLGIVFLDGWEKLDNLNQKKVEGFLLDEGIQAVVTEVSRDDEHLELRIESI